MISSRQLIKIILNISYWPLYSISTVTPKSKNTWVFSSWQGLTFSDNPKHLYNYIINHRKEINAVWITKDRKLASQLRNDGVNAFYFASVRGIYYQCTSSAAFFTHHQNTEFFSPLLSKGTKLIQLWHGTPLKKIHLDTPEHKKSAISGRKNLTDKLFPWRRDLWEFVISPSEEVSMNLSSAFAGNNIVLTGYPRNDKISQSCRLPVSSCAKKIIYMPTFRGKNSTRDSDSEINRIFLQSGFLIPEIDNRLREQGLELIIRLHPSNKLDRSYSDAIEKSTSIKISPSHEDIYEKLEEFDYLITDYSSIAFDFILSGKPIIHAGFDIERYISNSRELYYPFKDICLTPEIKNWKDIFTFIENTEKKGVSIEYATKYRDLAKRSNKFFDGKSSNRIYIKVLETINH